MPKVTFLPQNTTVELDPGALPWLNRSGRDVNRDGNVREEQFEGNVVDLACLRKSPVEELLERARVHTTACALMGHCVESGYGLVREDGSLIALDTATPLVTRTIREGETDRGVRLRVSRRGTEAEMQTVPGGPGLTAAGNGC